MEIGQEWTSRPRDRACCGLDEDFQRWSKAKDTAGATSQDVQLGPGPHAKVAFVQVLTRKYRYHVQVFARLLELSELELFLNLFNFLKHHIKQFAIKRMILFIIFKNILTIQLSIQLYPVPPSISLFVRFWEKLLVHKGWIESYIVPSI